MSKSKYVTPAKGYVKDKPTDKKTASHYDIATGTTIYYDPTIKESDVKKMKKKVHNIFKYKLR